MQSVREVLYGNDNNLLLINYDATLGRVEINLDSNSDQITIFNGIKNDEYQGGFRHAYLENYQGYGSTVSANWLGSLILETNENDLLFGDSGKDIFIRMEGDDYIILAGKEMII